MTQLWRSGLVSSPYSIQYYASVAVLDSNDSLFIGGRIQLNRGFIEQFAFVSKFNRTGLKLWEFWDPVSEYGATVDGMTTDGRGGVFVAFRRVNAGVQLAHLPAQSFWNYLQHASNYWTSTYDLALSVNLAADGNNGFYLTGTSPGATNGAPGTRVISRYDEMGNVLWRTNLFPDYVTKRGLERVTQVRSNAIFVCGGMPLSGGTHSRFLARLTPDGEVQWNVVSAGGYSWNWSRLAVLNDGTVCASGELAYDVFSSDGAWLASHGGQGLCAVARQADDAIRFLVSDWHSGHLVTLNPDGRMANAGQIANPVGLSSLAPEAINLSSNEWLVAAVCRELEDPNLNVFSFFRLGPNGELAWRQRFPGFEYYRSDPGNSWLFKASDGTIRFVANLGNSQAVPHSGVAVASFAISNQVYSPTITNFLPMVTNHGSGEVILSANATGSGDLKYLWLFSGLPTGATNATFSVPTDYSSLISVRVSDAQGEIFSPVTVVRKDNPILAIESNTSGMGLKVSAPPLLSFQIETSTNLLEWTTHPVIFSWQHFLPVTAVSGNDHDRLYFRTRDVATEATP